MLLINSEGNTDPDEFRRVVWEGGNPVPDRYKQFLQLRGGTVAGIPEALRAPGLLLRRYRAGDAAAVHEAALESAAEVSPYETWCHEGYTLNEAAEYAAWWDQAWDKGGAYY